MSETPESVGDRRPISARSWAVSQMLTDALVHARISANAISVGGAVAGILGGLCFAGTRTDVCPAALLWLAGAVLIQIRLLANMLDGMVAIQSGTASRYGELYNDVPDRISDSAFLIGAGYAAGSEPWLGWAAALAAMMTAYVRALGRGITGTQDFCGPMAKPHRMHLLCACAVASAIVPLIGGLPYGSYVPQVGLWIVFLGSVWTSARRLIRIAHRLRETPQ